MSRPGGGGKRGPAADRFRAKYVPVSSGCWLWTGAVTSSGYASFGVSGGRSVLAHRFSYEHHVGPIPAGLTIDHRCRVKTCVNPRHLEPVTGRVNTARHYEAITHCKEGHPLSGENLRVRKDGRRICVDCQRRFWREWYARRAA